MSLHFLTSFIIPSSFSAKQAVAIIRSSTSSEGLHGKHDVSFSNCDPILENREYRADIRFELQATLGRK